MLLLLSLNYRVLCQLFARGSLVIWVLCSAKCFMGLCSSVCCRIPHSFLRKIGAGGAFGLGACPALVLMMIFGGAGKVLPQKAVPEALPEALSIFLGLS